MMFVSIGPLSAEQTSASSGLKVSVVGVSFSQDNNYDFYVLRALVVNTRSDGLYAVFNLTGEMTSNVGSTAHMGETTGFASCPYGCNDVLKNSLAREDYQFLEPGVPVSLVIKARGSKSRGVSPEILSFVLKFFVRTAGAVDPLDAASRPMGPAAVIPINFTTVPITNK